MYFLPRFQNISKLNMEHSVKLEMEVLKEIAVAVHAQQTRQDKTRQDNFILPG